jgi:hypothetical protein
MTEQASSTPPLSRRQWMGLAAGGLATFAAVFAYRRFGHAAASEVILVTLHTTKDCPCCHKWAAHMEANGFRVQTKIVADLTPVKRSLGVPPELETCHSAEIGGYVVEGHVPADVLKRFLAERSTERGLAVPGMPGGSPGMESDPKVPYEVLAFRADGTTRVFARA